RRQCSHHGFRYRCGDGPRPHRTDIRTLLPCGPVSGQDDRRLGTRTVHCQTHRRQPRRDRVGGKCAGRRFGLHGDGASTEKRYSGRDRGAAVTTILLVEDERSYSDAIGYLLDKEGFGVISAETGTEALQYFERGGIDLVLLDLMLPGMSGLEVCRQIRRSSQIPIIMVTAKDDEVDLVVGLEVGADDYVTKPYSPRELIARIRAALRRRTAPDADDPVMQCGPVRMDVDRHHVSVAGTEVALPLKEFELLELLLRNRGPVLTRTQLIDRVWGSDYVGDTKTLDVHIQRLRAKIEDEAYATTFLVTVRGLGYKLEGRCLPQAQRSRLCPACAHCISTSSGHGDIVVGVNRPGRRALFPVRTYARFPARWACRRFRLHRPAG